MKKTILSLFAALVITTAINAQRVVLVNFKQGSQTISETLIYKAQKLTDSTCVVTYVNTKNDLQSGIANMRADSLLSRSNRLFFLSDSVTVLNALYVNSIVTRGSASTVLYRERKGLVQYNDARSVATLTNVLRVRND
jgi:hypothetical protein